MGNLETSCGKVCGKISQTYGEMQMLYVHRGLCRNSKTGPTQIALSQKNIDALGDLISSKYFNDHNCI